MELAKKSNANEHLLFGTIVKEALEDSDWNTAKATNSVMMRLLRDQNLFERVVFQAVSLAATTRAAHKIRSQRARVVNSAMENALIDRRGRVVALANAERASLLDFVLPGGCKLRHASREQIGAAADFYEKQGSTMLHNARWLRLIEQSVPPGNVAEDVISDTRAIELRAETEDA